ncbi:hypothetical protein [Azospirillum rugosum]|uniref:Uncharacterized protein n=1 Tax=Azospirillum rugosum TaxID=416170 RepID=A0ABS4SKI6_9PROT|nr:hypothetical protein [Azospirillum rugosum]MBP2292992.1 hypothetical protein [Azospirillum rugosum]MDQ0526541.1 hypothetical protein [Azospirillum rugosum]
MPTRKLLEAQLRDFLDLMRRAEDTASKALEFARAASVQDSRFLDVFRQAEMSYREAVENRQRAEERLRAYFGAWEKRDP